MLRSSALVIGDEILGGFVQDTNSSWLARHLQAAGVPLDRIHTVPDDMAAIDEALQLELARGGPRLVVTSGGIGSTPDDITFEAVAASLGMDLVEDPLITSRIEGALAWQADLGMEVTDEYRWHMMRMARLPAGGRLLDEEAGWIPGIVVDVDGGCAADGTTIAILPGVPSEFRRLLAEVIGPRLVAGRNPTPAVAEIEHHLPESALNLVFERLGREHPHVKLGSYPGDPMLVRLTGTADVVADAETFVRAQLDELLASPGGAALAAAWHRRTRSTDEDS